MFLSLEHRADARIMAGGCWTLSTGPAATVRATIARLRKQQQGAGRVNLDSIVECVIYNYVYIYIYIYLFIYIHIIIVHIHYMITYIIIFNYCIYSMFIYIYIYITICNRYNEYVYILYDM